MFFALQQLKLPYRAMQVACYFHNVNLMSASFEVSFWPSSLLVFFVEI